MCGFCQMYPFWHQFPSHVFRRVCLDTAVAPNPDSCLVYSFGAGGDLSFDKAMGQFGCEVLAFDDDLAHEGIERYPFPRWVS